MANAPLPYVIRPITGGPEVDEAYAVLDAWFGVRAELERREVIDRWLAHPDGLTVDGIRMRYHLLVARTPAGELAGVRDCYVTVDPARRQCVVYLAHAFVTQPHRRSGLAQRLREVPIELARADLAEWDLADCALILGVEQEFADPAAEDTLIRLVAYGRAGFKAIAPAIPALRPGGLQRCRGFRARGPPAAPDGRGETHRPRGRRHAAPHFPTRTHDRRPLPR
jgi:GNAT superfamily N-acetyltransferase